MGRSQTKRKNLKIIGLTGGIASGKSEVAKILTEKGYFVLDADHLARELSEEGGLAHAAIQRRFGTVDRKKLREIVFSDDRARTDLENLLHPLILKESERRFNDWATLANATAERPELAFYEAALLVEKNRREDFDGLWVVVAPLDIRKERAMKRNGMDEITLQSIIASQATNEERQKSATEIILNDGDLESLRKKTEAALAKLHI